MPNAPDPNELATALEGVWSDLLRQAIQLLPDDEMAVETARLALLGSLAAGESLQPPEAARPRLRARMREALVGRLRGQQRRDGEWLESLRRTTPTAAASPPEPVRARLFELAPSWTDPELGWALLYLLEGETANTIAARTGVRSERVDAVLAPLVAIDPAARAALTEASAARAAAVLQAHPAREEAQCLFERLPAADGGADKLPTLLRQPRVWLPALAAVALVAGLFLLTGPSERPASLRSSLDADGLRWQPMARRGANARPVLQRGLLYPDEALGLRAVVSRTMVLQLALLSPAGEIEFVRPENGAGWPLTPGDWQLLPLLVDPAPQGARRRLVAFFCTDPPGEQELQPWIEQAYPRGLGGRHLADRRFPPPTGCAVRSKLVYWSN